MSLAGQRECGWTGTRSSCNQSLVLAIQPALRPTQAPAGHPQSHRRERWSPAAIVSAVASPPPLAPTRPGGPSDDTSRIPCANTLPGNAQRCPRVSKVTSRPRGRSYPPTSLNSPSEPELLVSYKPKTCSFEPKLYKYIIKKTHRCKHVLREEEKLQ